MLQKIAQKQKAIILRKQGQSYRDILQQIPVAKSTLSLWLRDVGLSRRQFQHLTDRRLQAAKKGGEARKFRRVTETEAIFKESAHAIGQISNRELWLIGTVLYWAEGTKQKTHALSQAVKFSNSDPLMARLFLKWLKNVIKISADDLYFEIYIHRNAKNQLPQVLNYWAKVIGVAPKVFRVYFKRNKPTKRKNNSDGYYGLVRICVRRSTNLNRKIAGWVKGICMHSGIS